MTSDPRKLFVQHAQTTKLLGVDFHPLGDIDHGAPEPRFAVSPTPQASSTVEPKPLPSKSLPDFDQAPPPTPVSSDSIRASYQSHSDPQSKLDALREQYIKDEPHASFITSFTNIVFGEGDPSADLMFIGEAPGEQEDKTGRPFVGRAGQLLEKMIIAMGLSRSQVYIANVLKTRPPNNATPTREESLLCAPYLCEQIRIINPKIIVTLGLPATHLLLDSTSPMRSMRGSFHRFPAPGTHFADLPEMELMPTYHPAYLLRSYTEDNRRKVWSDLQQVMDRLGLKNQ